MKWYEIAVYTTDAGIEPVCGALTGAGLSGFSIEESREAAAAFLEQSALYWDFADMAHIGTDAPCVKAYLAALPENEPLLDAARAAVKRLRGEDLGVDVGPLTVCVTVRDDEDWANSWKRYYEPIEVGKWLLVLPSWKPRPRTRRTTLRLDPGLAFGTGAHHTTRMCLELLEAAVPQGGAMLDLGCGSGILSIAARLLGASRAVAVDIDPVAERIAHENAALNGVDDAGYTVEIGDVLTDAALRARIAGAYDVVVANIVADVIIRLAPFALACCRPGAPFIASGIIDEREAETADAIRAAGFAVRQAHRAGGWAAILAVRPA